jgi:hypothetical protein
MKLRRSLTLAAAALAFGAAPAAAQATTHCADVAYRYHAGANYTMVATSITARGVTCGQARHLAYATARAHVDAYGFRSCTRAIRRRWVNCEVPKHLDGFTLSDQHVLSDLSRITATRGSATVKFAIYRT